MQVIETAAIKTGHCYQGLKIRNVKVYYPALNLLC